jgi:hypothetical protein
MMSVATEPPRCVWSSASPSSNIAFESRSSLATGDQVERRSVDDERMRERLAIAVLLAVPLAGIDLLVKSVLPTVSLFLHRRSGEWMIVSAVLFVLALGLTRLPSRLLAGGAGLLAAGVLGNLVSASLHRGLVPNPFVIVRGDVELAFNLADVFVLSGIVLLTVAALRLAVRHRELLPESTIAVRLVRRVRSLLAPDAG